ncbi:DsrE/DsrF/TusD sulfur relay family protein [Actinomadura sp. 3N508]|uniref:DsrE/DsrF/TusD sulfur relay family protein n=1 Tax=Actinomadura sp. 3N508 TaxID=3375153 RepID=UPI00379E9622
MKFLFALHDPPYGTERTYNGIRWARQMLDTNGTQPDNEVKVFLFADAVVSVMSEQKTPNGFYNIASMLKALASKGAAVGICGTCLDARGIAEDMILKGAHRSSMAELADWTTWADQVVNV